MLKIKIKTNKVAFSLPVPYTILKAGSTIIGSKKFQTQMHKWANQNNEQYQIPAALFTTLLNRQLLNELIRELGKQKGTLLVDARLQDGTEVMVKL